MKHFIIDLETLGASTDAPITSIGAVVIDDETLRVEGYFYDSIDLETYDDVNSPEFTVDAATVKWWMDQSEEARGEFAKAPKGRTLEDALDSLEDWMFEHGPIEGRKVWGNGPSFDNHILAAAFHKLGFDVPWHFWNDRCLRSLFEITGVNWKAHLAPGTAHHALADATAEGDGFIAAMRYLRDCAATASCDDKGRNEVAHDAVSDPEARFYDAQATTIAALEEYKSASAELLATKAQSADAELRAGIDALISNISEAY